MSDRSPPRWTRTKWAGVDLYVCTFCKFDTTDHGQMEQHARRFHPRVWEGEVKDIADAYHYEKHPGGYYRVFDPAGREVVGPSNGKWQGLDGARQAARNHATGVTTTTEE